MLRAGVALLAMAPGTLNILLSLSSLENGLVTVFDSLSREQ